MIDEETMFEVKTDIEMFVEGFDYKYEPFVCDLDLCLVDVGSGSDTRVMAKKVLEWSKKTSGGAVF